LFVIGLATAQCGFGQPNLVFVESPQRLVRVSVVATNPKGEPITGLKAADLLVREDGKVRPIVFFRFAGRKRAAPPGPGEFINRAGPPPVVILFDRWNERMMTAAAGLSNINKALQQLESVERVYIYFLTNRGDLFPVHSLPATDADLRATGETTSADLIAKFNDAVRRLNGLRDPDVQDTILRTNKTFQALDALGAQMASIPGRKSLIWITHGVPLTLRAGGEAVDFTPQVRNLSAAATQSQIAIYSAEQSSEGAGAGLNTTTRETLEMFADLTGGRFYSSDSADRALVAAMADARGSYRLAYDSAFPQQDRKDHKIRVETARKDIRLRVSESYAGDATEIDPSQMEEAVYHGESHSPFDATEIGMRVTISRTLHGNVHFDIRVDPADVLIERHGDRYQGELRIWLALYSEGFLKRTSIQASVNINLSEGEFKQAAQDWVHTSEEIPVSSDIDKVRVIVFDRGFHGLGSVTVPTK
jgi:VWFA-related protein